MDEWRNPFERTPEGIEALYLATGGWVSMSWGLDPPRPLWRYEGPERLAKYFGALHGAGLIDASPSAHHFSGWRTAYPTRAGYFLREVWASRPHELTPVTPVWGSTGHFYLSTGCLHGDHTYCQAKKVGRRAADDGTPAISKTPGSCKFCAAPCRCACHVPLADASAGVEPAEAPLQGPPAPVDPPPGVDQLGSQRSTPGGDHPERRSLEA